MVKTEDMHIDVCTVADTHSASLQAIGGDQDSVLIISSSSPADRAAAFIVLSEDMQNIKGGVFADGQGHELRVAANEPKSVLGNLELCYSAHQFTLKELKGGGVALDVCNELGQVSIVGCAGNHEDFQTTVLQDLRDLHLEYTVKDGSIAQRELHVLPMDATVD